MANIAKHASKTYIKPTKNTVSYEKYNYPFLDIFLTKSENGRTKYTSNKWGSLYIKDKNLYPLVLRKYGNLQLNTPKNPYEYLIRCYGNNFLKQGIINYNHKKEKCIKPIKVELIKDNVELIKEFI